MPDDSGRPDLAELAEERAHERYEHEHTGESEPPPIVPIRGLHYQDETGMHYLASDLAEAPDGTMLVKTTVSGEPALVFEDPVEVGSIPAAQKGKPGGIGSLDGEGHQTPAEISPLVAQGTNPTAVKTGAYTAAPGDQVRVDISGGNVPTQLPAKPADKTRIALKIIKISGTPGSTSATLVCGAGDVFNVAGGSTTLTLSALFQGVVAQYHSADGVWVVQGTDTPVGTALGAAKLGIDGTVGGPGGSPQSASVVNDSRVSALSDVLVANGEHKLVRLPAGPDGSQQVIRSDGTIGYITHRIYADAWGAVGNGATDDTAAMQAVDTRLQELGGGIAVCSSKTYIVDGYVWHSGVSWEGFTASGTIWKAKAGSANPAMITIPAGRVRDCGWKNMQFLPNGNASQHCFYLFAQESEATSDGGVWQCYFENLRVGIGASAAGAWTGCCFWFRGGATGSKLPHQYINFRNVVAVRANTGESATTSRCFRATGECNQFNFDGSCNLQGQETYGKTGTNVELSREFLFATTLTAEAAIGASELKVASAVGLEANKQFSVGEGATNEILTVSSVEGTTIHLTGVTKFTHANGARCYLLSGTVGAPAENAPSVIGFDAGCTIQYGDLGILADHCSNVDARSAWMEGMSRGLRARVSSASVNLHAPHLANISEGESNGTGEVTVGSKTISKASGVWANGNQINGPGIPAGTTVESGGGTETLTLTAAVVANGTEGAQTIALVKGGRGEGYIAKYESGSGGHVHDHYIFGAADQGVISEGGNARVDSPTRGTASPATTSTGVVSTVASAETITIGNAREIVLTGSTSVKTILGQHGTGETLRIRISNAGIRLLSTGNIDLQGNGEVHIWPADVLTLIRTDTTSRTWKLVGIQRKQNTGASPELGASVKIANNGKESGVFNATGARIGDYVLVEYTNAFAADGVILRGEVREENKIHWWILNLSGAEITLVHGFIKGEALRPT